MVEMVTRAGEKQTSESDKGKLKGEVKGIMVGTGGEQN